MGAGVTLCGLANRIRIISYFRPFGTANQNLFVDSDIVPDKHSWYVLQAALRFINGNGAALGSVHIFVIPNPQSFSAQGNFIVLNALSQNFNFFGGIQVTPNVVPQDPSSNFVRNQPFRAFIAPPKSLIKGSLVQGAPGPGVTSYSMQMDLMLIDFFEDEALPNLL